jgi:L-fucose isomerase-like protein
MTLGVIIGNRDFFPDSLVEKARTEIIEVFNSLKIKPILLDTTDTKLGGVETFREAQKCADLFKAHREEIAGFWYYCPTLVTKKA